MFFDEIGAFIIKFLQASFYGIFTNWEINKYGDATSLDWCQIECWIILFVVFLALFVVLLCKSSIVEKLSKHILPLSVIVWLWGVLVYVVGFYNTGVNIGCKS